MFGYVSKKYTFNLNNFYKIKKKSMPKNPLTVSTSMTT